MRERDLDLIAALAEGSLEDEAEARALIASSNEARSEFEAQKLALEALSAVGPMTMSDIERASLRRDLWTEITSQQRTTPSKTPWYYRWAPVAASLFVVVGIGAVLAQNDSSGVTETFQEIGSSLDADGDSRGATDTTNADAAAEDGGVASAQPTANAELYADHAAKVREGAATAFADRGTDQDEASLQGCVDENSELAGYVVIGALPPPDDIYEADAMSSVIAAIPEDADIASAPIAFIDSETCEILHIDE